MTLADVTPEQLARALFDEIVESHQRGRDGYYVYGVEAGEPEAGDDFLSDVGLDGTDSLIEIAAGALARLKTSKR